MEDFASLLKASVELIQDCCSIADDGDSTEAMKEIGYQIGLEIGKDLGSRYGKKEHGNSLDSTVEELNLLWKKSELGAIGWHNRRLSLLGVGWRTLCDAADLSSKEGCMVCSFNEGFFEGALQSSLGWMFSVSLAGQLRTGSEAARGLSSSLQIYEIKFVSEMPKESNKVVLQEDIELRLPRIWSLLRS